MQFGLFIIDGHKLGLLVLVIFAQIYLESVVMRIRDLFQLVDEQPFGVCLPITTCFNQEAHGKDAQRLDGALVQRRAHSGYLLLQLFVSHVTQSVQIRGLVERVDDIEQFPLRLASGRIALFLIHKSHASFRLGMALGVAVVHRGVK